MSFHNLLIKVSIALVIFFTATFLFLLAFHQDASGRVCIRDHCFDVALATTSAQQRKGLMFQNTLDPGKGMLFVFDKEGMYPFWMKNTLIPLDIIWIDNNNQVVFMNQNTQPCGEDNCPLIKPSQNAKYVLEINNGMAKNVGLQVGDKVTIHF